MKNLILSIVLLIVNTVYGYSEELTLNQGAVKSLLFHDDVVEVSLSKDQIVSVSVDDDKRKIRVTGQNVGQVIISVNTRSGDQISYAVKVIGVKNNKDLMSEAISELAMIKELSFTPSGSHLIVTGRISSPQTGQQFSEILQKYKNVITDKTEKPFQNPKLIQKVVNKTLQQKGLTNYRIRSIGKILILEGTPRSDDEKELVLRVVRLIDPFIEDGIKDSQARLGETVTIDVMFLEVNRKNDLTIGFDEGPITRRTQIGSFNYPQKKFNIGGGPLTWTVAPFQMMLNLFQEETISKVITNPKIIVRSGEKAEFHSGSEIYVTFYEVKKQESSTVGASEEKEAKTSKVDSGVKLIVTPHVDPLKQIDLNIELSVTDFDINLVSNTPGATISRTKTTISLLDGYSALLTGFKGTRKRKITSRIPLLADIPILGELFKMRKFQSEKTEIMILLTVKSTRLSDDQKSLFKVIEKTRAIPDEMVSLEEEAAGDLVFSIFD